MPRVAAILVVLVTGTVGFVFQADPYKTREIGRMSDQAVLDHRDSPYAHVSWVISEYGNYAQLRFYDRVEGGVCLRPSWADLAEFNDDGSLDHVVMPEGRDVSGAEPENTWPEDRPKPNPGTLANSAYVRLYPAAVLLNDRLMREAGGDPARAKPDILVIGLGSGVGISVYAHHFPEACVTVVDIDPTVIRMVRDHHPFIDWLAEQETSDGRPRLKLTDSEAHDARQYIRHAELREDGGREYDVVILDAYTDGSTIPPHLMTREFFEEIGEIMPEDGIVLANIIGSYDGAKRMVLGGALRSFHAAGYDHVHNIPVIYPDSHFKERDAKNNIVLASRAPLDPGRRTEAWDRMEGYRIYPQFPLGRFVTRNVALIDRNGYRTSYIPVPDRETAPELARLLEARLERSRAPRFIQHIDDRTLVDRLAEWARERHPDALGWDDPAGQIRYFETDWLRFTRHTWSASLEESAAQAPGGGFKHGGLNLVGPEGEARAAGGTWAIPDAPLFTDAKPNADLYNR